jgi:hypothetical protein
VSGGVRKVISVAYNTLPREVVWAINCRRFLEYWREANVIFVHVPKAAGTSVSMVLYGRHLGHIKARDMQRYIGSDFQKLFKFAYLRNPWDRLYSTYHFVKQGGTSVVPVTNAKQYQVPEFSTFERFVYEWLADKDLMKLDYVFMPQSSFILDNDNKLIVDYIGYFERFNEGIAEINQKLGRDLKIPVVNEVKKAVGYRDAYNSQLRNFVGDLYKQDVEIGNYDF